VVACWSHLTDEERAMCKEARRRHNEALTKHLDAERAQRQREAEERRAAGIPEPEPVPYTPRPCIGECVSEAAANGRDSDSAMAMCARCDGYVCLECGKAPAHHLFGGCDGCEKKAAAEYDDTDWLDSVSPDLRGTLNSLATQIVRAGGGGYPQVQGQLNRQMGVQRRQDASTQQLQLGVDRAEEWLEQLSNPDPGPTVVPAPLHSPTASPELTNIELADFRRLLVDATAVLGRLRAFEERLNRGSVGD
jgi:hypothetical protein